MEDAGRPRGAEDGAWPGRRQRDPHGGRRRGSHGVPNERGAAGQQQQQRSRLPARVAYICSGAATFFFA